MARLRGVIVDDHQQIRWLLSTILETDPAIEIVGEGANGEEALELVGKHAPDFLTIDIQMPRMNGLEAIGHIMANNPLPIIVISGVQDSRSAYEALSNGALEVIPKTDLKIENADMIARKVRNLAKVTVIRHIRFGRSDIITRRMTAPPPTGRAFDRIIAIASSTGGPRSLSMVLSKLPVDFPFPVLIAQHIVNSFVPSLVEWMNNISPLTVKIGADSERPQPGFVYISPADGNMAIDRNENIVLLPRSPTDVYRPSCNVLLSSTAEVFGKHAVGVVMTGMGNDGAAGIRAIREYGGTTIAQDRDSSVVFGMPKEAADTGCVDRVLPLDDITRFLLKLARGEI